MKRVEVETVNSSLPLKLRIGGMDCASCALKIENAMKRLPGVSDINVSYGQESLTLYRRSGRAFRTVPDVPRQIRCR
ncbi:cation transporter [Paraburkholderia sp. WSM4177]|uniref:cation transporter n=1 Tax=unclassified Paraburkholderia TaxID=2615204 RepID=UPI0017D59411|nr:cation transport ATPase [Paraburkholderia sp. WSM4177]MBB5486477.1 cation transport ATPase [Paraburkholderia sp. WSM4180]